MAIMFKSYWQPFLVLTAVPFGYMGAIFGHTIIGVRPRNVVTDVRTIGLNL
jgi:multidrug efflux pump subunit AcrB